MVKTKAKTPAEYLRSLPPERRKVIAAVRAVILKNLPAGYVENISWGVLSYELPLATYPNTHNGLPLVYAGLAAQKNYFGLYLTCVYWDQKHEKMLRDGFRALGKRPNMGKCCIRFQRLDDLPLRVVVKIIKAVRPKEFIRRYEASRSKKHGR